MTGLRILLTSRAHRRRAVEKLLVRRLRWTRRKAIDFAMRWVR